MNWLITILLGMQALLSPHISVSNSPSHTILVDHVPATAFGVCIIFQSEDELLEGKPWAPRHCWYWEGPITSLQDDWAFITPGHNYEIWAEFQTQLADGRDGPDIVTNHIHEAH